MSDHLAELLDLSLASRRVLKDQKDGRAFVIHPYEAQIFQQNNDEWLNQLREEVRNGFNPSSARPIADIPKGAGAVRPGVCLSLNDRIVYSALLVSAYPSVYAGLRETQGVIDFSYQLSRNHTGANWFDAPYLGWSKFRTQSIEKLGAGAQFVVITDITGYYENIDFLNLASDLRELGVDRGVIELLSNCLNRWSIGDNRGIPQSQSPSDILGKIYLNNVDLAMVNAGFDFIRYVDDIRIFCQTEIEAKKALLELSQLLRRRSLNLQSAKTKILTAIEARDQFEGVVRALTEVANEFFAVVREAVNYQAYLTIADVDRLAAENPNEVSPEVLTTAFDREFGGDGEDFNSTFLHYILNRLAKVQNDHCLRFCLDNLSRYPHETPHFLKYFSAIGRNEYVEQHLVAFLNSDQAIYDYQNYLIVEWISKNIDMPSYATFAIVRIIAFDQSKPLFLRSISRQVLAAGGQPPDLERIQESYDLANDPLEKAQILCDLKNMETGRRNAFYGRVRGDDVMCSRAINMVRQS